jgi:hypothetical protein
MVVQIAWFILVQERYLIGPQKTSMKISIRFEW